MNSRLYMPNIHGSIITLDPATPTHQDAPLPLALRNVADAQGGMTKCAKKARLNRENLYRILSKKGNPELTRLTPILVG